MGGSVVESEHDLVGKGADLVRECWDLFLDGGEQDELAKTGQETGGSKGEHKQSRGRRGVGDGPPDQGLVTSGAEPVGKLDADAGRERPRRNVHDVERVEGVTADELGSLLHDAPPANLAVRHRHAHQDGEGDDDADEGTTSYASDVLQAIKESVDPLIVGTEAQLLLLGHRKGGSIEFVRDERLPDLLLDLFERQADDGLGGFVDLGKSRDRPVELVEAVLDACGQLQVAESVNVPIDVERRKAAVAAKKLRNAVEALDEPIDLVLETVDALLDVVPNLAQILVEKVGDVAGDVHRDVQTAADGERDETDVCGGEQVDDEDDDLLDARDGELEQGQEAIDGLLDAGGGQLVGAL